MNKKYLMIGIIGVVLLIMGIALIFNQSYSNVKTILPNDSDTITVTVESTYLGNPDEYLYPEPQYKGKLWYFDVGGTDGKYYQYFSDHDTVMGLYEQVSPGDKIKITYHDGNQHKVIDSYTLL